MGLQIIRIFCRSCGKKIKVDAKFAGKNGTCPGCGTQFTVPTDLPVVTIGDQLIPPISTVAPAMPVAKPVPASTEIIKYVDVVRIPPLPPPPPSAGPDALHSQEVPKPASSPTLRRNDEGKWHGIGCAGCLVIALIGLIGAYTDKNNHDSFWNLFGGFVGVWIILFVIWFKVCDSRRCPSCKSFWARRLIDKVELMRKDGYETAHRVDTITDGRGNVRARVHRRESVMVTRVHLQNQYECKICGHAWRSKTYTVKA